MQKVLKIGLLLGWIGAVIYISLYSFYEGYTLESYIYWLVLIGFLLFIWLWKRTSSFSLYLSFGLFIISTLVVTIGFKEIGEPIMRLSFIFLLVGFIQSFIEYWLQK